MGALAPNEPLQLTEVQKRGFLRLTAIQLLIGLAQFGCYVYAIVLYELYKDDSGCEKPLTTWYGVVCSACFKRSALAQSIDCVL